MEFRFSQMAVDQLKDLNADNSKKRILKDVLKALRLMEENIRHPSLNTHEFSGLIGKNNEKVFEAYAQQNTPGAYRIFWHYGPSKNQITVVAITPHPNKKK